MSSIFFVNFLFLSVIFSLINGNILSHIEQPTLELRVQQAETILFGRFHWAIPMSLNDRIHEVYADKQNTFEFIVYCTIKKSKAPENVPRVIHIFLNDTETEIDMKKNSWFIVFPRKTSLSNTWMINNRSDAFDLEDDLELRIFEQFCFLKPKLPIGFPTSGLLNRCPKPSREHCFNNGTAIRRDELLELKTFLTSTTTRKPKPKPKPKITIKQKRFIEPVW